MAKDLVLDLKLTQIRVDKFFFFKNLALSVTRYYGPLSSCTISEKTNDPIWRKLSDGQIDRQTDRQTDKSDFIVCYPPNVERPFHIWDLKFGMAYTGTFKPLPLRTALNMP